MSRAAIVPIMLLMSGALGADVRQAQPSKPAQPAKSAQPGKPAPAQTPPGPDQTKTLNLAEYAELLRSDVQAQKIAIITEVMEFTDAENAAFWPIYRDYNAEMAKLGDERVALIEEYARAYPNVTDAAADSLATKALDLEARRQAARNRCFDRVRKALPARQAFRFMQVEHQLLLLIDLQIAASLPIANR